MICDHCGADTAKMEGTVKRCWCGLWIETQPEVDDIEAQKAEVKALGLNNVDKHTGRPRSPLTKAEKAERHQKWVNDHIGYLKVYHKAWREKQKALKQQRAA